MYNDVEHVASTVDFVFSAVDMTKEEIKAIEEEYAKTETPVVSNNSAHRWTPDVPMVVPEINSDHLMDRSKKASWNNPRIHRGKTELLHPELCAMSGSMERIWTKRSGGNDLPGDFRSRKDIQRLAGDGGEHHSLYWRRRRKERAGAASCTWKGGKW